jgi:DNA-binding Lrp family transcriptional regulator
MEDLKELERKYPYTAENLAKSLGLRPENVRRWGRKWVRRGATHLAIKIGHFLRFSEQAYNFFSVHRARTGKPPKTVKHLLAPPKEDSNEQGA